ncbi:ABC transporter substrate-binding protein, partial [Salmonella enterica subsp. enterica serovar Typhimurium]
KEAVELWNKKNPNTQVTWIATEASRKIYPKMLTAVKANNAPDLAQVGYEALPSFVIQDAVQDIKEWAGDVDKNFTAAGAKSVNLGGAVYGIPVDTAPMAMIYNKALLD